MADATPITPLDPAKSIEILKQMVAELNQQIGTLKSPLWQKYQEAQIAQYDQYILSQQHNGVVLAWQSHASEIMLWVVVAVVISGLVFSAVQLVHAMQLGKKTDGTFDLSVKGLKVTSSIVGVLILGLSIAFVVIFVDRIYQIQSLDAGPSSVTVVPGPTASTGDSSSHLKEQK